MLIIEKGKYIMIGLYKFDYLMDIRSKTPTQ
jgi:hypothetical protein